MQQVSIPHHSQLHVRMMLYRRDKHCTGARDSGKADHVAQKKPAAGLGLQCDSRLRHAYTPMQVPRSPAQHAN